MSVSRSATESATALSATTLTEAFQLSVEQRPNEVALRTPDGTFELSWRDYADRVRRIAAGLAALGVGAGDTVGMLLRNRPEFQLIDTAVLHLGATPFSMYTTSSRAQLSYLIENAGNRVLLVEKALLGNVPPTHALEVIVVDGAGGDPPNLQDLERLGDDGFDLAAASADIGPDAVATLIYTSGTTGPPKGVEITHANLHAVVTATAQRVDLVPGGRLVSYLPHAHLVDRLVANYFQAFTGASITVVDDPKLVLGALPGIRPTMFTSVPRVWSKLRAALLARFQDEPSVRRRAIEAGLQAGVRRVQAGQAGDATRDADERTWREADVELFMPLRRELGLDAVRWLVTGAAPMPGAVNEFYAAIGLPLSDCWGMSETSGIGTINDPRQPRIGSVGWALPGTELRTAADDELLVRGPNVMKGYRNDPARTREAVDEDGWLHTGDVATIDGDGAVRIVDRKKELIISAGGKNMSPVHIETVLRSSTPLLGQVCCIGDGRPYNVALLVLDPDAAAAHAAARGRAGATIAELAEDPDLLSEIEAAVERANDELSRPEQVKRHVVLSTDWVPDGDELTPTMKLKRRRIHEVYRDQIDALYADVAG